MTGDCALVSLTGDARPRFFCAHVTVPLFRAPKAARASRAQEKGDHNMGARFFARGAGATRANGEAMTVGCKPTMASDLVRLTVVNIFKVGPKLLRFRS